METRRSLLRLAGGAGAGAILLPVAGAMAAAPTEDAEDAAKPAPGAGEKEVGAVEDLMREHGVLRRAFLVYSETAAKLREGTRTVNSPALHRVAQLFRDFGEDYHERKLEEGFIFPRLKKAGGPGAALVDVLLAQHNRGREVTDFILNATKGPRVGRLDHLAFAFVMFGRMYAHHTAREDTIVFPAWKAVLSDAELQEMGEKFEEIEHQQFGADGFEKAVKEIGEIEETLGFANLAQFTMPAPPSAARNVIPPAPKTRRTQ